MSEDLSEKWGYGVGRAPIGVDPRPRPQDAVPRLASGRWAPRSNGYFDRAPANRVFPSNGTGFDAAVPSAHPNGETFVPNAEGGPGEGFGFQSQPRPAEHLSFSGNLRPVEQLDHGSHLGAGRRSEFPPAAEPAHRPTTQLREHSVHYRDESARARRARVNQSNRTNQRSVGVEIDAPSEPSSLVRSIVEWAAVLIAAVLIALLVQRFVIQAFWIPSSSMENTLEIKDKVFVDKLGYKVKDVGRGDIVVFHKTDAEIASRPDDPKDIIKRVIGLPGETILIQNNQVTIDGQLLLEPYLEPEGFTSDFGPSVVPDGHFFVMGDNREQSADSRFELGPVAEDRVVGRAFVTFWPLGRLGPL